MKKTTIRKVSGTGIQPIIYSEPEGTKFCEEGCKKIDKLEIDLGRGDLNLLRDKINEVIEKQNGC